MMRTYELWRMGERYVPNFRGVFPLNKLPRFIHPPANLIVNTHTHNLPGEHWIAVSYQKGGIVFAFDPFGIYYPHLLRKYLLRLVARNGGGGGGCNKVHYNTVQFQEIDELTCGLYCIAWLICINK